MSLYLTFKADVNNEKPIVNPKSQVEPKIRFVILEIVKQIWPVANKKMTSKISDIKKLKKFDRIIEIGIISLGNFAFRIKFRCQIIEVVALFIDNS